jgi:hypothetical protein
VLDCPGQDGEEAGVFGVVVGLDAEEFTELGDYAAVGIFYNGAVAGRAGVAARAAVAVGGVPAFGGGGGQVVKEVSSHRFPV